MEAAAPIPSWQVATWTRIPGLRHRFYGRRGGFSTDEFSSLNLSEKVGDRADAVAANRRRVIADLAPLRLAVPQQVHGDVVNLLRGAGRDPGQADGLIAAEPGIAVGILTADCVPILLIAPEARVVAAVHAGWKGTALRIARRAVEAIEHQLGVGAECLQAALGPSIGGCCFEVGAEVVARLEASGPLPDGAIVRAGSKARVDLRSVNAGQLERAGIPRDRIFAVGPCTRCASSETFSHRGASGRTGRQLSAVGFEGL